MSAVTEDEPQFQEAVRGGYERKEAGKNTGTY